MWILLKQETVSGNGISWVICKSALRSRQITTQAPHHSVFLQAGCPSCRPTNSIKEGHLACKKLSVSNTKRQILNILGRAAINGFQQHSKEIFLLLTFALVDNFSKPYFLSTLQNIIPTSEISVAALEQSNRRTTK